MYTIRYIMMNSKVDHWFENHMIGGINHDFLLISNSSIQVRIDGTLQMFPADTAFYFPKGTPYYYCANGDEPYEDHFIQFDFDGSSITSNLLPVGQPIPLKDPARVYDIMHVIAYENVNNTKQRADILNHLMEALLLKIYNSIHSEPKTAHDNELLHLRQMIYQHPEQDWTLARIATLLNMSPNYIHQLYKQAFHTTCRQDLIASRMNAAKHQLLYTSKPIYLIALQTGYHDIEHFQRQFKKKFNISPLKYRQKHQTK